MVTRNEYKECLFGEIVIAYIMVTGTQPLVVVRIPEIGGFSHESTNCIRIWCYKLPDLLGNLLLFDRIRGELFRFKVH